MVFEVFQPKTLNAEPLNLGKREIKELMLGKKMKVVLIIDEASLIRLGVFPIFILDFWMNLPVLSHDRNCVLQYAALLK